MRESFLFEEYLKILVVSLSIVLITGIAACSNFYQGFKAVEGEKCYNLPYPDQDDCLREMEMSFDEYKEERKTDRPEE